MAETLSLISIISFVLCGVFLLLAVFFFFHFRIVEVMAYLSGKETRRSIEQIQRENKKGTKKRYQAKEFSGATILSETSTDSLGASETQKLDDRTTLLPETEIDDYDDQYQYDPEQTTSLWRDEEATSLLYEGGEETTAIEVDRTTTLAQEGTTVLQEEKQIEMIEEIMIVDTDEIAE